MRGHGEKKSRKLDAFIAGLLSRQTVEDDSVSLPTHPPTAACTIRTLSSASARPGGKPGAGPWPSCRRRGLRPWHPYARS